MLSLRHRAVRALGHQFWLPKRMGLARRIGGPAAMPSERFEAPFFGVSYSGILNDHIDWHVYAQGGYALEELALLDQLARRQPPGFAFYDVGANVGHHTLFMAPRSGQVVAFDPFPQVFEELGRKVRAAGLHNVQAFNVGLGQEARYAPFDPPTDENRAIGSFVREPVAQGTSISLKIERGDDFIKAHSLPPIGILKIDVEGLEAEVLSGLRETILRDRPPVLLEMWGPNNSGFRSVDHLMELLYPGATLLLVHRINRGYQLEPYNFGAPAPKTELVALPPGSVFAELPMRATIR